MIDPILQASYAGGSGGDVGNAIAVAPDGDVYVAGSTLSFNFPGTRGGAQPAASANSDAFVARFSADLTVLRQATYLGGAGSDAAFALAIDATGAIVIAGSTNSTNFPGTAGGPQSAPGGGGDAFVARLSADLTQLLRATYAGGSAFDQAFAVLATADGAVYVAGSTASTNFPATGGGAQPVRGGNGDGFVARFSADLGKWVQSTYVGGTGSEIAYALVRDATGAVFVAGSTSSPNLPGVAGGLQSSPGGNGDAFVAKFDASLQALARATYLGGAGTDVAYALAYDGTAIVVAGDTASTNFPVTARSAQPVKSGGDDAFVTRLDPGLATLLQSTFVGGLGDDLAYAVAVDPTGAIFIAGDTLSAAFPATANGAQARPGGSGDAFIARLDATLATLVQATYIGGSGLDQGFGLALDARGHAWITGGTSSFNLPPNGGRRAGGGGRQRRRVRRDADGEPATRRFAGDRVSLPGLGPLLRHREYRRDRETRYRRVCRLGAHRPIVQGAAARHGGGRQRVPVLQRQLRAEELALLYAVGARVHGGQGQPGLGIRGGGVRVPAARRIRRVR